ncbi:FxsA family membrane protein [Streptomyces antimicrobicus]|uniref:FxsA family protein n=1 Tax=Streptomyces antimicrobicus TaxID=2883108 RepID=A0ABS8B7P1_9ACTN|nr:FxsA family membrane protein [Streptomyces antimicrobicus]MCB5180625.1 FxsA family protein [Streptomyces antimicrobicus]
MTTGVPTSTAPRRRSPARTFTPLAIAAWLVLEIWLLTLVADAAGAPAVAALLLGGVVLGAVVIKRAGRRAFGRMTRAFQEAQAGRAPATGPGSGKGSGNGTTMLAGLLLMVPGLLSDLAGLLLLVPPVRSWVARRTERAVERRIAGAAPGTFGNAFQQARIHHPDGMVVPGEVVREDGAGRQGGPGPQSYRPPLAP